jgi:hypothetical protein
LPLLALVLSGPGLATLVVAALTFLVAAATLYLHVADRRPRLSIHPVEAQYYRDGRVVARAYDFAKRRFLVHNAGTKPVKLEEVRVEFDFRPSACIVGHACLPLLVGYCIPHACSCSHLYLK